MDTIKMYIENLFRNLPETEAIARAKEELLAMMEDKYSELKTEGKSENEAIGIVISEFGNIDELREELEIGKQQQESKTASGTTTESKNEKSAEKPLKVISLAEAENFTEATVKFSKKIALGVFLCITSPVLLILLGGLHEMDGSVSEKTAAGFGILYLFVSIAFAVATFIINAVMFERYEYIKKEKFVLDEAAASYAGELRESYAPVFARNITIGVVMCILSVIPVICAGVVSGENENMLVVYAVLVMFAMIAIAVTIFITSGMKMDSYKQLMQEGEYSPVEKESTDFTEKIGSVYWPVIVAIYLGVSFLTGAWGITWIIWPVAGVLFGAVAGIGKIISSSAKERR